MKTKIEIELKPFSTPNVVMLKTPLGNGSEAVRAIPLKEIDASALDKLCDDFASEIFEKAGKSRAGQPSPDDNENVSQDLPAGTVAFPSKPNSKVA